jgi:phospholipid/cholesterol/gamma-HCH transport system ATP-binding protein
METAANLVEIRGLRFAYGRREVLRGVDLDIPRGHIVAILGTSGSGKSTLLQLLGGLLKPAAGVVKVFGENVHAMDADQLYGLRRRMGVMFQKGGLFSDLTTLENVAFPIREHTDLPDEVIRDLALMKLHSVGLRGAQRLMPARCSSPNRRITSSPVCATRFPVGSSQSSRRGRANSARAIATR